VENLFTNVNVEILEIPFSLESANHSLAKIIAGEPPSASKNQQFKDGVIWADCLDLSNHDDVALVTEDQGFYDNR